LYIKIIYYLCLCPQQRGRLNKKVMEVKYKVGTKFIPISKRKDTHTIIDIYTTRNLNNDIIEIEYACQHQFMKQIVNSRVIRTTIDRAQIIFLPE